MDTALELRQRAVTFFVKRVYIHPIRNKAEQRTLLNYPPLRIASIKQSNSPETIYDSAIVEWQRRDPRLGWVARAITVFPSARVFSGEKLFKKRKKQLLDGSVTLLLVQEWNAKILFSSRVASPLAFLVDTIALLARLRRGGGKGDKAGRARVKRNPLLDYLRIVASLFGRYHNASEEERPRDSNLSGNTRGGCRLEAARPDWSGARTGWGRDETPRKSSGWRGLEGRVKREREKGRGWKKCTLSRVSWLRRFRFAEKI